VLLLSGRKGEGTMVLAGRVDSVKDGGGFFQVRRRGGKRRKKGRRKPRAEGGKRDSKE